MVSPKTSRRVQQLQKSRSRNGLLAVLLHSCARLEQGEALSDLEEETLNAVRKYRSDDDLREFGRIYQDMSSDNRALFFPGRLATLPVSQSYSQKDFSEDLETIIPELLNQPNVRTIDVKNLTPGEGIPVDEAYQQSVKQYGFGILKFTSSAPQSRESISSLTSAKIRLRYFKCYRRSDEWAVDGGSTELGAKVITWPNDKVDHFKWHVENAGDGYFYLIAKHSGQVLAVDGGSTELGAKVITWSNDKVDHFKWRFGHSVIGDQYFYLIAKHSGKWLSSRSGNVVQTNELANGFKFEPV